MTAKRKSLGRHRRNKGHGFERQLCQILRRLFPNVGTSRQHSRERDKLGVDLVNTGALNIQAKAWASAPSYHATLAAMPQEPGQHNVIAHKRPHKGTVVVLALDDFLELVERAELGEPEQPPTPLMPKRCAKCLDTWETFRWDDDARRHIRVPCECSKQEGKA